MQVGSIVLATRFRPTPHGFGERVDADLDSDESVPYPLPGSLKASPSLRSALQDASPSLADPEYERLLFVNTVMGAAWPRVGPAVLDLVRAAMDVQLEAQLYGKYGGVVRKVDLVRLDLGPTPPRVDSIRSVRLPGEEMAIETALLWGGGLDVRVDVTLGIGDYGVTLPVEVRNVSVRALARVTVSPLVDRLPCVGGLKVSLLEIPTVDAELRIAGSPDLLALPGVPQALRLGMGFGLGPIALYPSAVRVPIMENFGRPPEPTGMLRVRLLGARGLRSDMFDKVDPFVTFEVREDRPLRSSAKDNDENPNWDEEFEFVVDDPNTQFLTVMVRDDDLLSSSLVGAARVPLTEAPWIETPGVAHRVAVTIRDVDVTEPIGGKKKNAGTNASAEATGKADAGDATLEAAGGGAALSPAAVATSFAKRAGAVGKLAGRAASTVQGKKTNGAADGTETSASKAAPASGSASPAKDPPGGAAGAPSPAALVAEQRPAPVEAVEAPPEVAAQFDQALEANAVARRKAEKRKKRKSKAFGGLREFFHSLGIGGWGKEHRRKKREREFAAREAKARADRDAKTGAGAAGAARPPASARGAGAAGAGAGSGAGRRAAGAAGAAAGSGAGRRTTSVPTSDGEWASRGAAGTAPRSRTQPHPSSVLPSQRPTETLGTGESQRVSTTVLQLDPEAAHAVSTRKVPDVSGVVLLELTYVRFRRLEEIAKDLLAESQVDDGGSGGKEDAAAAKKAAAEAIEGGDPAVKARARAAAADAVVQGKAAGKAAGPSGTGAAGKAGASSSAPPPPSSSGSVPQQGVLSVDVRRCLGLAESLNTYVVCTATDPNRLKGRVLEFHSPVVLEEEAPHYKFRTDFVNVSEATSLTVTVFEMPSALSNAFSKIPIVGKKSKHRMIGYVQVSAAEVAKEGRISEQWPLQEAEAGEMDLAVQWVPIVPEE